VTRTARSAEISRIKIPPRHRRDVGDLASLKASITELGLLHPIVLSEKGRLIAGERRLRAAKELGWKTVPIRIVRNLDEAARALKAEQDENTCRKDFLPSELVTVAEDLETLERRAAKQRQAHGGPRSGKLPERSTGDTRDKLASAVGVSGRTLEKARAVVVAAREQPAKFERLCEQMDRTGNVHGAFKQLEKQKQAETIAAEPPPLPTGPFRVIVADPPWRYEIRTGDVTHRGTCPYPDMSVDAICALPVKDLAAEDCVLWLWTTNVFMRESYDVLQAWGFESKTILTWVKQKFGTGQWLRGQTEHCHLAVRGKPTVLLTNQSTALLAAAGEHSAKPEAFYALVEALCPGSKVELFARRHREGWALHGNAVARIA
jgi:N6-adenosine-specific RNA methylase IME4